MVFYYIMKKYLIFHSFINDENFKDKKKNLFEFSIKTNVLAQFFVVLNIKKINI